MTEPISRRALLRSFGVGGTALAASSVLAACGGATTSSPASSTANATALKLKRGGQLRIGYGGGSATSAMDAHLQRDGGDTFSDFMLYDQLTHMGPTFKLTNVLAEEINHNSDGTEWTVRLRPGVEFHNGKTVTADDVVYSFQRILDPKTEATAAGTVGMIKSVSKVDARTSKFTLKTPTAWFDIAIGDGGATGIVPVGYDPKKPVGTGPFKYQSWQPGVNGEFTRNANYFDGPAYLDSVTGIVLNDDSTRFNALLANQVDAIIGLGPAQTSQISSHSDLTLYNSPTGSFTPITMRTDRGPLKDVRIRQALRLCLDRDQVISSAFGGYAQAASDLYSPYDPAFDRSLKRTRDVAKAKQLVQQAGASGTSLTLVTGTLNEGSVAACQVLAANAQEIGLNVKVKQVDLATLFGPNYLQWDLAIDSYPALRYLTTASLNDAPGAAINATHFDDPEYGALWKKASAEFDEDTRAGYLKQMQQILFERGGWIIPVFPNVLGAYKSTISGFVSDVTGFGMNRGVNRVGYIA